jgi:hypothetical protein
MDSKALAARLTATRPHQGIARQWFRSPDVLALLPFDTPQAGRFVCTGLVAPAERAEALRRSTGRLSSRR